MIERQRRLLGAIRAIKVRKFVCKWTTPRAKLKKEHNVDFHTPESGELMLPFACVSRPVVVVGESVCDALFAHAVQG